MSGGTQAILTASGVWKVFGARPERAIALADDGVGRDRILADTGCTVAVHDVSFEVAAGETFVVMGLSGSGKSTLVRCLSRLTDVTAGSVTIDGRELTTMDERQLRSTRRDKMSMVFQHFGLFPHRRVVDNVAYGLEVRGVPRRERHARAEEVLALVGLAGWSQHYPQQLSGGMQQRVGLARALAVDPEVLFFDEPFSALDPLIRREMQDELIRLQTTMNRTIVFITHDFDEAIRLGDRIAIMKDGAFDQVGTPSELIIDPATPYVREFTKDVSRAKVLTAASVARLDGGLAGEVVEGSATIDSVLPLLLRDDGAIGVVDEAGASLGSIDRALVAALLGDVR